MTLDEAAGRYQAALAAKTEILAEALRQLLVQRPFVPDPGATADMVDGVHFEHDWPSFKPVICPLSTTIGYCANTEPLTLLAPGESPAVPGGYRSRRARRRSGGRS